MTLGDVIPKAIKEDFDLSLLVNCQAKIGIREDSSVPDAAQPVTDSVQYNLFGAYGVNGNAGL